MIGGPRRGWWQVKGLEPSKEDSGGLTALPLIMVSKISFSPPGQLVP